MRNAALELQDKVVSKFASKENVVPRRWGAERNVSFINRVDN